jgi:N-methylhydantoinase A/oxoprolinase/acetone carboxylase beta subunit
MRVGIDTGGTFTDFVFLSDSGMRVGKVLSTPRNPALAILRGLREAGSLEAGADIIHGSTVATNALLERKGSRLAFLTTAGFEDILSIGRQTRRELYNILVEKREPLIPHRLCFGLPERTLADGRILHRPDSRRVASLIARLKKERVESVALCFLHSYANPANEEAVRRQLEAAGLAVSASHRVLCEYREFERASTTAVNAYVGPLMARYLGGLEGDLPGGRLRIMQSNGGCVSASGALEKPVATILSGPAGGAVGALECGTLAGFGRVISFDMGGTSTDVSLCDGGLAVTTETVISDLPLKMPVIDIHTVGSGGGSLARPDPGGALRVGPESAGADPGPACYGRGQEVTVTDANLVLGRLDPANFLGGKMALHPDRARRALEKLAGRMGLPAERLAEGVLRVADAVMERAIRVISVERGYDPRDFALLSFGGAGGMHACSLARRLRIPTVIVPKNAGVLSALGMLLSDVVKDYSRSVLLSGPEARPERLARLFQPLLEAGRRDMRAEGFSVSRTRLLRSLDVRYVGQSYEITVPFGPRLREAFDEAHLKLNGYADRARPVEVVNLRVKAAGLTEKPALRRRKRTKARAEDAVQERRTMIFEGEACRAPIYKRELLGPGSAFQGPALVCDFESTAVLPPDFSCRVDGYLNLILEPRRSYAGRTFRRGGKR